MLRTHTNGELRKKDVKKKATLCGWVQSRRDHGGVIFIDLRDRYGLTQLVFDPSFNKDTHKEADKLRREDVIRAFGVVSERKKGMKNPKLHTGDIEVFINKLEMINKSETPPIEVEDDAEAGEDIRLKYRYIDLRRPLMQKRFALRHQAAQAIREFLNKENFLELETPLLIRSTPEGARDYVVPSRVHPGKFYSLPQSPQLYKQIFMIAGFDRYYQFARCLRDEDLRQDRQPEHTQVDLEMSFAEEEDIFTLTENMMKHLFKKVLNVDIKTPFLRLTFDESMEKYGVDKPDLRFDLELVDVSDIAKNSDFKVFKNVVEKGGIVKCIVAPKCSEKYSRKDIDAWISFAQANGASGLAWMKVTKEGLESSVVKFFSEKLQKELLKSTKAKAGDLIMFIADNPKKVNYVLSRIRNKLGADLGLIKENEYKFAFVTDFPLFEWNDDEQKWDAMHHLFTIPKKEHIKFLDSDPKKVYGRLYDLTLNGVELFSGSVRNHDPELQKKVMKVIGMSEEDAEKRFGFLLEAYRFGGPIHAGFGLGFDRLVALMQGLTDIREVIAFPKTKSAENPMDGCPTQLPDIQLKELHIGLSDAAKKKKKKNLKK